MTSEYNSDKRKSYYARNKEKIIERAKLRRENFTEEQKEHARKINRDYQRKYKHKMKEWRKKWLDNNREYEMYHNAYQRAKHSGIPFDIKSCDISIPTHCPILGIELLKSSTRYLEPNSPTLDRVVNNKGYVKGNIAVISNRANRLKNNATLEELESLVRYVKSYLKEDDM